MVSYKRLTVIKFFPYGQYLASDGLSTEARIYYHIALRALVEQIFRKSSNSHYQKPDFDIFQRLRR
jgi:hypothetical protein